MTSSGSQEGPGSPALITFAQPEHLASGERASPGTAAPAGVVEALKAHDDRLQFQRVLAVGGMGSVLHMYDPRLQRHLAMKVLHAHLAQRQGELDVFLGEARVTAQLDHPNIVPVHDVYVNREAGWAGFTMKLVQGESLEERLRKLGPTRLDDAELGFLLGVLIKVCDAVSFAHSRNLLHLDLKPANIMIGSFGQVYVMDWGIAVKCVRDQDGRLRPAEPQRSTRGTLAYMAPEQLDRELRDVDERADVYALGGTLYELLTGQPPFLARGTADDQRRKARHVVSEPVRDPGDRPLPAGLLRVALRALAQSPSDRYPSVEALKAEIERLRQGGGWFSAREFAPGEVIIQEGDPGHEAFIVAEGTCQVFKLVGGSERLLRVLSPGDVFGEMAILTQGPRTATVLAASKVRAWVVTRDTLLRELGQHAWVGALVKALADRFLEADSERARLRAALEQMAHKP